MANIQNLVPAAHKLTVEDQSKGGKASVERRREKKNREEMARRALDRMIENPNLIEEIREKGVDPEGLTVEEIMDEIMTIEAIRNGKVEAYKATKEEAYGKQTTRQEVEVTGELSGININIKNYEDDDGNRH